MTLFVILFQLKIIKKLARMDKIIFNLDKSMGTALLNEFQQIQAMDGLQLILKLEYPMPSIRGWAGSPDFLLQIAKASCAMKPKNMLECSSGTSTVVLARTAKLNGVGHVYSLESDEIFAQKTRDELNHQGLADFATVIYAPLVSHSIHGEHFDWYSLDNLPRKCFDMLVIDGPPANLKGKARYPALPLLSKHLRAGAVIFLDDAGRIGEQQVIQRWRKDFPEATVEHIAAEKGLVKIKWTSPAETTVCH